MTVEPNEASTRVRQAVGSSGEQPDVGLARQLSELALELQAESDPQRLLDLIVQTARNEIDGAQHAGITLLTRDGLSSPASTDEMVVRIDQEQYTTDQGPCVRASKGHTTVRSDDLDDDQRWPEFGRRAAAIGVRSMLSVQLFVEAETFGALNLYSAEAAAFSDADETIALLLASHAAIAMAAVQTVGNLQASMRTRDVIGQAKGILMERFSLAEQEAFNVLVVASQRTNRKLRDIADELTHTGEIPKR